MTVADEVVGGFQGLGLVALVGVTHTDTEAIATRLARRIWELRIFERPPSASPESPREWSAADLHAPVLVVSQFTLYARTNRGRRPTWDLAAPGGVAEPLILSVVTALRDLGADVSTGVFGATMEVSLANIGPMTIVLDTDE